MKKSLVSLLLLTVLASAKLAATTRVVNNSTPAPGQFSTIAAAITAASAGDTILVAGSPNNYGSFTINKNNLVFIGNGHNPQKTPSLSTFADVVTLATNLNGCKIMGFNLDRVNHTTSNTNVDNVSIEFCNVRFQIEVRGNNNNWTIKNCIFTFSGNALEGQFETGRSNIAISNNVFSNGSRIGNFQGGNTGILISNNVFLKGAASDGGTFPNVDNALITNNIFYQVSPTGGQFNNIYNNNITFSATNNALPPTACTSCGGAGNFVNQNPLFTAYTAGQNFSAANHNLVLAAGSPGLLAGTDGTDIGVFGNGNTFSETGESPVPTVRVLTISNPNTAVGATVNFNVTVGQPDPDQ